MQKSFIARGLLRLFIAIPLGCGIFCTSERVSASTTAADAGLASVWPDLSWAAAIQAAPWAQCAVYPQGASNDPTRTRTIQAAEDGNVRFYLPQPAKWGSKLALDCTLNGQVQGHYTVDMSDNTTFMRQSGSALDAKVVRTLPPLTGDVAAMSDADLFQAGYPARPDPSSQPQYYSAWLQSVSQPATVAALVDVADLDVTFGFSSSCSNPNWAGMVQASGGFFNNCTANQPLGSLSMYEEYVVQTVIPQADFGCEVGFSPCQTGIWAGLGGFPVEGNSFPFFPSLLQHGFVVESGPATVLMYEWVANNSTSTAQMPPLPSGWNPGDMVQLIGAGVASSSCSAIDSAAPWGCFIWNDFTTNRYVYAVLQNPSTSTNPWVPATFEYIAEVPSGQFNMQFETTYMQGWGTDFDGNRHFDDGNSGGGDPYVADVVSSGVNAGFWNSGNVSTPLDPWFIEYESQ